MSTEETGDARLARLEATLLSLAESLAAYACDATLSWASQSFAQRMEAGIAAASICGALARARRRQSGTEE